MSDTPTTIKEQLDHKLDCVIGDARKISRDYEVDLNPIVDQAFEAKVLLAKLREAPVEEADTTVNERWSILLEGLAILRVVAEDADGIDAIRAVAARTVGRYDELGPKA